MPEDIGIVLSDPDFHKLPLGQRLDVLRRNYPDFAKMDRKQQGNVVADTQRAVTPGAQVSTPEKPGFFTTLGRDIASIPGTLMATGTGEPGDERKPGIIPALGAAQHEQFEQGRTAPTALERAGHTLAGALPVVGPIAASIGESLGEGRYGEAAARGVELAAPDALKELPLRKIGRAATTVVRNKVGTGVSNGARAASDMASKLPKIHPVAKFLAKRIPGVGTTLDLVEILQKQYGHDLAQVPKQSRDELAYSLYRDNNGLVPDVELSNQQRVQAIKDLRQALAADKPAAPPKPSQPVKAGAGTGFEPPPEPKPAPYAMRNVSTPVAPEPEPVVTPKPYAKSVGAGSGKGFKTPAQPAKAATPATSVSPSTAEKIEAGRVHGPDTERFNFQREGAVAHNVQQALPKTLKMAEDLKAQGITPEDVLDPGKISDDQIQEYAKKSGFKEGFRGKFINGKRINPWSRTIEQARRHLAEAMRTGTVRELEGAP